jgi:hypothetical protein
LNGDYGPQFMFFKVFKAPAPSGIRCVLCQFGVSFSPGKVTGYREARRVMKSDVWDRVPAQGRDGCVPGGARLSTKFGGGG